MNCCKCERELTGHESEMCMDCSNTEMVEDKEYTRNTISGFKEMGYTKSEILDSIKGDRYIKLGEVDI